MLILNNCSTCKFIENEKVELREHNGMFTIEDYGICKLKGGTVKGKDWCNDHCLKQSIAVEIAEGDL